LIDSEVQRLIEQMSSQAQTMVQRMQDVRGVGSDDKELIRATCGPGGRLLDLEFAPEVRRLQTHELREQLLIAVQRAAAAADESLREATGAASGLADGLGGQGLLQETQQQVAEYQQVIEQQMQKLTDLQSRLQR
jgi:hypothetical protein